MGYYIDEDVVHKYEEPDYIFCNFSVGTRGGGLLDDLSCSLCEMRKRGGGLYGWGGLIE